MLARSADAMGPVLGALRPRRRGSRSTGAGPAATAAGTPASGAPQPPPTPQTPSQTWRAQPAQRRRLRRSGRRHTLAEQLAGSGPVNPSPEAPHIGELVARISADDVPARERSRLMAALVPAVARTARGAGRGAVTGGRWLADTVVQIAPNIPVRTREQLVATYGGLSGEALADALTIRASRITAAVGAAGGAVAAVEWATAPLLLSLPAQILAETLVVVTVELKLVAELHAVYEVDVPGNGLQRGTAFAVAWANKRGVDVLAGTEGLTGVLSAAARQQLSRRMVRRGARNTVSAVPFLAGALAGAELNRRETRVLGDRIAGELRRRSRRLDRW